MKKGLGRAIRSLREKKKLTQDKLGERIGVDRATISKYESGKHAPEFGNLLQLAGILGVELSELFAAAEGKERAAAAPSSNPDDEAFLAALRTLRPARQAAIRAQVFDEADQILTGPDPTLQKQSQRSA